MAALEIIVLEHEPETPAALFEDWARERGHELRTLSVPGLARWPDPHEADVVVSLGSERSVARSPEPWIAAELDFLRGAHDAGVPVLGICFGGQALAKALGGEVARGERIELSWASIDTQDPDLIASGPWLRWHEDVFTVPPRARQLARAGEVALAFVQQASVGLQFHPEVDGELADAWIETSRRRFASHAADLEALRGQARLAAGGAPTRARDLFDRIARLWPSGDGNRARRAPIRR
jgi:GMP synthase-like glutamine amidotransferase